MLIELEPRLRARLAELVSRVGEGAFRRGVASMTGFDTSVLSIDDVVCVYLLARQGRIGSPEVGRRAAALHQKLPGRTPDDAGFTDAEGKPICKDEWERQRARRRTTEA